MCEIRVLGEFEKWGGQIKRAREKVAPIALFEFVLFKKLLN
jgi:hypothetical protein